MKNSCEVDRLRFRFTAIFEFVIRPEDYIWGTGVGLAGSNTSGTLNKSLKLSG